MHNQQDKMWVTSTPSSEEMGRTFRNSFLESPQPMDIWQQKQFEQLAVQRHPFYERNYQNEKQVNNAIYNYEVAQRIKTGDENSIKSLLRAYMFNGSVSLSTLNRSRLKLLGIEITYTGMDLGVGSSNAHKFVNRYGNTINP